MGLITLSCDWVVTLVAFSSSSCFRNAITLSCFSCTLFSSSCSAVCEGVGVCVWGCVWGMSRCGVWVWICNSLLFLVVHFSEQLVLAQSVVCGCVRSDVCGCVRSDVCGCVGSDCVEVWELMCVCGKWLCGCVGSDVCGCVRSDACVDVLPVLSISAQ